MRTVLHVDVSSGTVASVELHVSTPLSLAAGPGLLGVHLLGQYSPPQVDAFDPRQPLIFSGGAASGAPGVAMAIFTVVGKSPLSGGIGEARVEGPFAAALRRSGFAAILLTGRARRLTYLVVRAGRVTLHDASELAGLGTAETADALHARHGVCSHVACIGPAGERLVRFASVIADGHAAARTGLGAVMGSKCVKALVLVDEGDDGPPVSDSAGLRALTSRYEASIDDNPLTRSQRDPPGFGAWPRTGLEGYLGAYNFKTSKVPHLDAWSPQDYLDRVNVGEGLCPDCPQHCIKTFAPRGRPELEATLHQEAIAAFAANLGLCELDTVLALNARCQAWGVDPVSMSFTLSMLCETVERQRVPEQLLAHGAPRFGSASVLTALAEDIALRRGAATWLADGAARAARRLGGQAERLAMTVKNIEMVSFDPRGSPGQALGYAINATGPRYDAVEHDIDFDPLWGDKRFVDSAAALGVSSEGFSMDELPPAKVTFVARLLELWAGCDAGGICLFAAPPTRNLAVEEVAQAIASVTGSDLVPHDILALGRERLAAQRRYNLREGLTAADDRLPLRFFEEEIDAGRFRGARLKHREFARALTQLYGELGWNRAGVPRR
jgi:aldehyde:ferredoxin oxidoreductase